MVNKRRIIKVRVLYLPLNLFFLLGVGGKKARRLDGGDSEWEQDGLLGGVGLPDHRWLQYPTIQ